MAHVARFLLLTVSTSILLVRPSGAATKPTNATDGVAIWFYITACDLCTNTKSVTGLGQNTIWCTNTFDSGLENWWVRNDSVDPAYQVTYTLKQKVAANPGGSSPQSFCWSGTFGSMLYGNARNESIPKFTDYAVSSNLICPTNKVFYNNCTIDAQSAIIMMVFGALIFIIGVSVTLLCCGCCMCCNRKGDTSKYGCCNRFCPWCKICADAHLTGGEVVVVSKTGQEDASSLTGRNVKLDKAYKSAKDINADTSMTSTTNPSLTSGSSLTAPASGSSTGNPLVAAKGSSAV